MNKLVHLYRRSINHINIKITLTHSFDALPVDMALRQRLQCGIVQRRQVRVLQRLIHRNSSCWIENKHLRQETDRVIVSIRELDSEVYRFCVLQSKHEAHCSGGDGGRGTGVFVCGDQNSICSPGLTVGERSQGIGVRIDRFCHSARQMRLGTNAVRTK